MENRLRAANLRRALIWLLLRFGVLVLKRWEYGRVFICLARLIPAILDFIQSLPAGLAEQCCINCPKDISRLRLLYWELLTINKSM